MTEYPAAPGTTWIFSRDLLARYLTQFTTAVWNAHAGEDRWVAGVGILSCHTVWAEPHQD